MWVNQPISTLPFLTIFFSISQDSSNCRLKTSVQRVQCRQEHKVPGNTSQIHKVLSHPEKADKSSLPFRSWLACIKQPEEGEGTLCQKDLYQAIKSLSGLCFCIQVKSAAEEASCQFVVWTALCKNTFVVSEVHTQCHQTPCKQPSPHPHSLSTIHQALATACIILTDIYIYLQH